MELVSLSNVQPGQVIARAVTNAEGTILCPSGSRLTELTIARLKRRGIDSVVLEGASRNLPERLAQLSVRFRGVEDPVLLKICAAIERRLQLMLREGKA